ncbi:efflux RND transporter periplasmic adaptor subunit [Devosia submarina]|uniref:efflux RND transporter periplasmic adaptor subunit n=1 Tax=Devosia submarina TaxID=1173082 RepID=UPI000D3A2E2B|nr:efflux RND transporter periplasmic adaptor subunit [Devosia submarina]
MIRQILASLIVLAAAAAAWVFFVPGSTATLASYGISLPFGPEPGAQAQAGPGGPGGRPGGRGGGRQTNVVTTPVTLATINADLQAVGEARAANSVTVTSPSGGTLEEVLVRPGQVIEAGAVIARLDADAEQLDYDRAKLAADDANATLTRTESLAGSSLVATTALTAAQLAANNANLELRTAEVALERRTISSPIDGTVGLIKVTPGNYVAAQTAVTTIDDSSSILVDFFVPERYAAGVAPGASVTVSAVAIPGSRFNGEVVAVDNRLDPASRTLQVQAEIPNERNQLRAGMSFSVALSFPGEQYPAVNPLAILWSAEGSYVWKYEDGKATKVMAEIVQRNSDGVLVRADLAPGDPIITEGILQLSEGAEVTLLSGPDGSTRAAQANP